MSTTRNDDHDGVDEPRIRSMALVRLWLTRFIDRTPPGMLIYGITNDELRTAVRDLDLAIGWLQNARDCAERERRRRRIRSEVRA